MLRHLKNLHNTETTSSKTEDNHLTNQISLLSIVSPRTLATKITQYSDINQTWNRGDLILQITPIIIIADLMDRQIRCDSCLDINDSSFSCSDCQNITYCSEECQQNDFTSHKLECQFLRPKNHDPGDRTVEQIQESVFGREFRLLLKLLVVYLSQMCQNLNECTDSAGIKTLQHLSKDINKEIDSVLFPEFEEYYLNITDYFATQKEQIPDKLLCWNLYQIVLKHQVMLSCFGSSDDLEPMFSVKSGFGILPSIDIFQRSCSPNAEILVWKGQVYVKAITNISGQLSNVSVMSGDVLQVVEQRQEINEYSGKTVCSCQRCCREIHEPYLIACSKDVCHGVCLMDKKSLRCQKCLACGSKPHSMTKNPEKIVASFHTLIEMSETSRCINLRHLQNCLSRQNNPFHKQQLGVLGAYCVYANALLEQTDKTSLIEGCNIYRTIILPAYSRHAPNSCVQCGIAYLIYGMSMARAFGSSKSKDVTEAFTAAKEKLNLVVDETCGAMKTLNCLLEMITL